VYVSVMRRECPHCRSELPGQSIVCRECSRYGTPICVYEPAPPGFADVAASVAGALTEGDVVRFRNIGVTSFAAALDEVTLSELVAHVRGQSFTVVYDETPAEVFEEELVPDLDDASIAGVIKLVFEGCELVILLACATSDLRVAQILVHTDVGAHPLAKVDE
jgi:hypothetical protein